MDKKCHWCTRPADGSITIRVTDDPGDDLSYACGPECKQKLRAYFERCRRGLKWLFAGYALVLLVTVLLLFYGAPHFREPFAVFVGLAGIGLLVMRYPIVTQNTIESLGVLKSLSFVRFSGGVLIAMGILEMFLIERFPLPGIAVMWVGLAAIVSYWIYFLRRKEYPNP